MEMLRVAVPVCVLRSSSPPRKGRHLRLRSHERRRNLVAILVPSEEGTPPCLSRSPSIVHRVFRRICG